MFRYFIRGKKHWVLKCEGKNQLQIPKGGGQEGGGGGGGVCGGGGLFGGGGGFGLGGGVGGGLVGVFGVFGKDARGVRKGLTHLFRKTNCMGKRRGKDF